MGNDPFFLGSRVWSQPIRLHWAGWTTTTAELQRAGWELAAHQDVQRDAMSLAINHRQAGYQGISHRVDRWGFERMAMESGPGHMVRPIDLGMNMQMGREIHIHESTWSADWISIDAEPSITHANRITLLEDFAHFAPRMTLEAPFVLPEPDVDQLLQLILEKQQKAKTDYFRDLVAKEGAILPAHTMSAQIISLRAA